jgi:type IV pilus assembly protein PilB
MGKLLIGEILIERKRITQEQLSQALEMQKKENVFVGEILVKLGYIDERDIVVALIVQCGFPYIAINKYTVAPEVLKLIPKEIAVKERVIPLERVGDVISVVMMNPLSEKRKAELESLTKCRIAPFIATKSEIEEAIASQY